MIACKQSLSSFLTDAAWEHLRPRLSLSPREVQIVRLILEDEKEKVIAWRLQMSAHTVHTHLERIYHKLGINGRMELVLAIVGAFLRAVVEPQSALPSICWRRASGRCPLNS